MKKDQSIALFNKKTVRRHWDGDKEVWCFSVIDVIEVLTDEWQDRGMREGLEFAILTDEITRAWANRDWFRKSRNGKITSWNKGAERILGKKRFL